MCSASTVDLTNSLYSCILSNTSRCQAPITSGVDISGQLRTHISSKICNTVQQKSRFMNDLMDMLPCLSLMLTEMLGSWLPSMLDNKLPCMISFTRFMCLQLLLECSRRTATWCKLAVVEPTATPDTISGNVASSHLILPQN